MFGSLGGPEILFIFVLALLLFGPRKLPQIGRTIGRTLGEFRKATHDFRSSLEQEIEMEEVRETRDTINNAASEAAQAVTESAGGAETPYPPPRQKTEASDKPPAPGAATNADPAERS